MTDQDLKLALTKMLPDILEVVPWKANPLKAYEQAEVFVAWKVASEPYIGRIRDTEWLHVCHLLETKLSRGGMLSDYDRFENGLAKICIEENSNTTSASWQMRAKSLCKVKGIAI